MAVRGVDAPEKRYLTSAEAAKWLGWSKGTFNRVVGQESDWLHETGIRGPHNSLLYYWMDIVVLGYLYSRRPLPEEEPEPEQPEQPPRKASKREKSNKKPDTP